MKTIKALLNPWFLCFMAIGCLPFYALSIKPLKAEPNAIEARHSKKVASYLTRYECRRINRAVNTPNGLYECRDGFITFREIEVHVWKEMQY